MKKIAFYIESLVVGGAEKVLIDLVNNMNLNQFDITVISIFKNSVYDQYCYQIEDTFKNGINYRYLIDNGIRRKYLGFNYLFQRINKKWIYKRLVKEQFDIEIAFYEGLPTEFVANSANKRSIKLAWLHTNQDRLYKQLTIEEKKQKEMLYKNFDKIIAVSNGVKGSFHNIFPEMKVKTLYNPVNIDEIRKKSMDKDYRKNSKNEVLFVSVGRLIPIKGYDRLLQGLKKIKQMEYKWKYWMIGDGSEKEKLENLIRKLELEDNVKMLGHQDNPYYYLKNADYLICSSYEEGFSTVVLEAMALGVPVITTDCTGMKDIFGMYECGIICENSQEGLEVALSKVLNEDSRDEYVKNALDRINEFSIENRIQALEEFLNGFS